MSDPEDSVCHDHPSLAILHNLYATSSTITDSCRRARDRAVAEMIDAGMSYGQVAREMGVPRGTVQSIVRKVRGERDGQEGSSAT